MIKDMSANHPVSQGTPSEKFTALNTSTYQNIVTRIGIQYIVSDILPIFTMLYHSSSAIIPQKILLIYEIFILVRPMMAPTPICMRSRMSGGIDIGD
jgi:hypothetical protein